MDDRWVLIGELLEAARAQPAGQREAWVRAQSGDEFVTGEVLALLGTLEADPDFLERPVSGELAGRAFESALGAPAAGRQVGPYHLIREIGRGGMGVVYEAEKRDAEFTRRVAVKLVPSGWSAASLVARFRQERRLLARLDHPAIAKLLDAGTTEDGTPYFVMEYVDGLPIDRWCDDRALPVRQRIELVVGVAEALEHAHSHLIVHRDIKPSNIFVAEGGQPKLLDFGIAKLLSDEAESSEDLTRTGQQIYTPEYASPEQIRGEGLTTSSDVYSLGVLTFRLAAGTHPYDLSGLTAFEAMKKACDANLPRPSELAPADRKKLLAGDLDNIILLATRKDARDRYQSMRAFADDLRAWLGGRAVSATPATLSYRARTFVRRHRIETVAAGAVLLVVGAGTATTAWQAHVARVERDKAESRFREVRQFSRSLLFEVHDAISGLQGATPARNLLLSRAMQFLDGLAKDAGGDLALMIELGAGYRKLGQVQGSVLSSNIGDSAGAMASFRKAVALGEDVLRRDPRSVPGSIVLAGACDDLADVLLVLGDLSGADAAQRRHEDIIVQMERTSPDNADARASAVTSYSNLGFYRGQRGDWAGAKSLYARSIDLYNTLPATQQADERLIRSQAYALKRLGAIHVKDGELDQGERRYQAALALDEALLRRHPDNANYRFDSTFSLGDLAVIARNRGDRAKAESLWVRALAIRQDVLAADPKNVRAIRGVGNTRSYLGDLYRDEKRFDEAVAQCRECLDLRDRMVSVASPQLPDVVSRGLALVYLAGTLTDRAQSGQSPALRRAGLDEASRLLALAEPIVRKVERHDLPESPELVEQFTAASARSKSLTAK